MVRFSDIIRIDSKSLPCRAPAEPAFEESKRRQGDPELRIAQQRGPAVDSHSFEKMTAEAAAIYETLVKKASEVREKVLADEAVNPAPVLSDLKRMAEQDLIDRVYEHAVCRRGDYEQHLVHSVDVTVTSMKMSQSLGYDPQRQLNLGLCAFVENVGMYKIPENLLKKTEKLEDSERALIMEHPEMSSRILSRMGEEYRWVVDVALQVHERADGSGYPRGLEGPQISEFASIIGLADIYTALIRKRPNRDKLLEVEAIKFILKEAKGLFHHRILKAFLNEISLFPVNTYLRLNNKSTGRVTSTVRNQPLRPMVQLIYDGLENKLEKKEMVRLSDNPLLYVTDYLKESELP
jgi:HD-GYP domain-containing protein (c-di-GMP phosphodiesterase class II)